MPNPISTETIQSLIIEIRGERVLLDSDVARIYGVATRDINKAVSNNPEKFPAGYIVVLTKEEGRGLVESFHRFRPLKHSTATSKAFPEKGLYMLATILKSKQATTSHPLPATRYQPHVTRHLDAVDRRRPRPRLRRVEEILPLPKKTSQRCWRNMGYRR